MTEGDNSDHSTAFSRLVDVDDITSDPRDYRLAANADQCAAIAKRLRVEGAEKFEGAVTLWREGQDVLLKGEVAARLARTCVVSLNPMTEDISEHFRLRFMRDLPENFEDEPEDEDFEQLPNDVIDIGDVLMQQAVLAMSPHPRLPNAEAPQRGNDDRQKLSPFSVLKGLVDEPSGTNS